MRKEEDGTGAEAPVAGVGVHVHIVYAGGDAVGVRRRAVQMVPAQGGVCAEAAHDEPMEVAVHLGHEKRLWRQWQWSLSRRSYAGDINLNQ